MIYYNTGKVFLTAISTRIAIIKISNISKKLTQEDYIMQLSKRLSAAILTIIMMFTLAATSAFAAKVDFSDVPDNSPYKEAIETLAMLDLLNGYEDGTFGPERTITRAEFAAVITRALGLEGVAAGASAMPIFNDMVNSNGGEHWGSGYIKIAYDREIIDGYGDGRFGPDDPVTYEQAVKMIVCTLGYGHEAEQRGGWPMGYLATANDKNVTRAALMTPTDQPAPRGMAAKLVFNSLEIQMMEKNTIGDWSFTKATLLNDKLKVYKMANAMITDVDGVSTLNSYNSTLKAGEVMLEISTGAAKYNYSGVSTSAEMMPLLGQYVTCYYKYDVDADVRTLISIIPTTKSLPITVMSDDVISYDGRSKVFQYWTDKEKEIKARDLRISDNAKLVLNGRAYDCSVSSNPEDKRNLSYWLDPKKGTFFNGEVKLLDSGNDGVISVIFLTTYDTYVVKSAVITNDASFANNYIIYDYYETNRRIQMDPTDRDIVVNITNIKTGKPVDIEYLQPINVISIAQSADSRVYNCFVSTETVSGSIDAISSEKDVYHINKKEYQLTPELQALVASNRESMAIGSSGTFYLDMYGRIAAVKVTEEKAGNYAYLTRTDLSSDGETGRIRLYVPGLGTMTDYTLAARVRVNGGTSLASAEAILDELELAAGLLRSNNTATSANYSQLVKFSLNSAGRVDSIYTATRNGSSLDIGTIGTSVSVALKLGMQVANVTYTRANTFSNGMLIDANTTVIVVPVNRTETASYRRANQEYFKVGRDYDIETYDVNSNSVAKVVVVYGEAADAVVDGDTPLSIVTKILLATSSRDGSRVYSVEAYQNGRIVSYETEGTDGFETLAVGDVARFALNSYSQITSVKYTQRATSVTPDKTEESPYESGFRFKTITGTVTSVEGNNIHVVPAFVDGSGALDEFTGRERWEYVPGTTKVYTISQPGSAMQVALTPDINTLYDYDEGRNANASKVTLYMHKDVLTAVIIHANR